MTDAPINLKLAELRHGTARLREMRRAARGRCEVIVCAKKGPHRCERRAGFLLDAAGQPRFVCAHHVHVAPHKRAFTADEATALYRAAAGARPA